VLAVAGSAFAGGEPDGSLRVWVDGEYLLWWLKPVGTGQPLLTTGPLTNPTTLGSGILGTSGAQVLAGDQNFNTGPYSGFRVSGGWIDCSNTVGVDGSFFYLARKGTNETFASDSGGNPVLSRPVIDARTGNETVQFVAAPNAFAGTLNVASSTRLFGFDTNLLLPCCRGCCDDEFVTYLTPLAGFRYLNLDDDLNLMSSSNVLPLGVGFFQNQPIANGGNISVTDDIRTLNQFYGGQVGVQTGLVWWRFTLNGVAKVALGSMRETANFAGSTSGFNALFGTTQTASGGLLALNTNSAPFARNMVAVVPEGTLTLAVEITSQIKLTLGYNILYVSNVARPGNVIDRSVNRTQIPSSQTFNPTVPGPQRPFIDWNGTDFWAQGINVGLSLHF
jgi:hypothetical protein